MSFVYVVENGALIGIDGGTIRVTKKEDVITKVPKETVESIAIFGNAQMTTQCTQYCLKNGISVSYYSKYGTYFGRLMSTGHINIRRQKKQIALTADAEFSLCLSKRIIESKINNQVVLAKRYLRNLDFDENDALFQMENARKKVSLADSIEQIMGYEGIASRYYFQIFSDIIEDDFKFNGRNRQPPRDPFNSMISLGYTLLMNELYGEIESRGLNPYAGFLHQDKENHPTLASDMIEEWRAILVDSTVLSLIQGHELIVEHFYYDEETGACLLDKEGMKIFLRKFEKKLHSESGYIREVEGKMSFRKAIWHQVGFLVRSIESGDAQMYQPIKIR